MSPNIAALPGVAHFLTFVPLQVGQLRFYAIIECITYLSISLVQDFGKLNLIEVLKSVNVSNVFVVMLTIKITRYCYVFSIDKSEQVRIFYN